MNHTEQSAGQTVPNEILSRELAPVIDKLYQRHLSVAPMWYPHEFVPWSKGRDFTPGEAWSSDEYPLPEGVRSAINVNLQTEDNLPYYTQTLLNMFGEDHIFNAWMGRWTAEENRHSTVIRDWVNIMRPIDPQALEDARMHQMSTGQVPKPPDPMQGMAYVSFQELATQVAHRNTGKYLDDFGKKIMGWVAGDETRHYNFYKDLSVAMFEIDSSAMMIAVAKQLRGFAMPGTGIIDFEAHKLAIAEAGIYDVGKFKELVVEPTLEHWGVFDMTGLNSDGERARKAIETRLRVLGRVAGGVSV